MIEQDQQLATEIETSVITMTATAAEKVRELLTQENDPSLGLRIFVAGGGCSGLQYGMTLDERQEDDIVAVFDPMGKPMQLSEEQKEAAIDPREGFKVFVDSMSASFVGRSRVDYYTGIMGSGFTVDNPNAVSSCGCGHSFKTADSGGDSDTQARSCGCGH